MDKSYVNDVYQEFETRVNNTSVDYEGLKRGECRFDYSSWESRLNVTHKKMITAIKKLSSEDKVILQTFQGKKGKASVYFLTRFEEQKKEQNKEQNKPSDCNGLIDGEERNFEQNKEQKTIHTSKYINLNIISKYNYMSDSNEYRLAEFLYNHIYRNNNSCKKPDIQKWSKSFDYILRIDKRDIEEVKKVIVFSQTDSFWMTNILSPDKLRKQYDQLLLKMKQAPKQGTAKPKTDIQPKCTMITD